MHYVTLYIPSLFCFNSSELSCMVWDGYLLYLADMNEKRNTNT